MPYARKILGLTLLVMTLAACGGDDGNNPGDEIDPDGDGVFSITLTHIAVNRDNEAMEVDTVGINSGPIQVK